MSARPDVIVAHVLVSLLKFERKHPPDGKHRFRTSSREDNTLDFPPVTL
jgi:hypothetical protein